MLKFSMLAVLAVAMLAVPPGCGKSAPTPSVLLNVSYDPTRELYQQINESFVQYYKKSTGETVTINQSHGGSGGQSRKVTEGLEADVVTLALAYDIDAIAAKKLLAADWQKKLPDNSTPYTSTIVFVVKKGNPKNIHDWDDLIKGDVTIVVPNPKTSGGARWAYLAAYGQALLKSKIGASVTQGQIDALGGAAFSTEDDAKAREYVKAFYKHAPTLAAGARESTLQFAKQQLGDVMVGWENEAHMVLSEFGADKYEIITPPLSILAEPPVAVVDTNVESHGTRKLAEAYLKYLYTSEGQEIIARNFYRPRDAAAQAKYADKFDKVTLFTIDGLFGGWTKAQAAHFADKGVFDQVSHTGGLQD